MKKSTIRQKNYRERKALYKFMCYVSALAKMYPEKTTIKQCYEDLLKKYVDLEQNKGDLK